ncbi:unnamed protein product, partial [Polarella glacialis]
SAAAARGQQLSPWRRRLWRRATRGRDEGEEGGCQDLHSPATGASGRGLGDRRRSSEQSLSEVVVVVVAVVVVVFVAVVVVVGCCCCWTEAATVAVQICG